MSLILNVRQNVGLSTSKEVVLTVGARGAPGIPGPPGPPGPAGPATIDVGTTTTGAPGSNASVINAGTNVNAILDFTIPRGDQGVPGSPGTPGADGKSVLNGTGAPSNGTGNNGDFYIDTATDTIYGPKAGGVWPTPGTSLVGPQGPPGPGQDVSAATHEPLGHKDRAESTISFDNASRTFTIAPTGSTYEVWCAGTKYDLTTQSVTIPNTTGLYYIYFDTAGVLQYKTTYFDWPTEVPTSYVYWNQGTGKAEFFADERHGITLDWATHEYLHRTRGAAFATGFSLGSYSTAGTGAADADAQMALGDGTFFDEDLEVDVVSTLTPTPNTWEQNLVFPMQVPVFRLQGTAWQADTSTAFPLKQGTARAQYNLLTGSTWSSTDAGNGDYVISWLVATNNLNTPVVVILGQSSYVSLPAARNAAWSDLVLTNFPVFEFRPLYKLIFETKTSYSNTPHARLSDVQDLRGGSAAGGGTVVSDHGLLAGLADDDHTQYALADGSRGAFLLPANNLSDVSSVATARTNLGLETQTVVASPVANLDGTGLVLPGRIGNYASAPDSAALDITGNVQLVSRIKFTNWDRPVNQSIITKRDASTAAQTYSLGIFQGFLRFNGLGNVGSISAAATTKVPFTASQAGWVRATLTWGTPVGGCTVVFEYAADSPTEPVSWTSLGSVAVAGAGTAFVPNNAPMEFGTERLGTPLSGSWALSTATVYRSIVRTGATTVLDADFSAQPAGTLSFTESSSNAATITVTQARRPTTTQQVVRGDDDRFAPYTQVQYAAWGQYAFSDTDFVCEAVRSSLINVGTMTAPRTLTLPDRAAFVSGQEIMVWSGNEVSATNTLTVQGTSGQTINGAATYVIRRPRRLVRFVQTYSSTYTAHTWAVEDVTAADLNLGTAASFDVPVGAYLNGSGLVLPGVAQNYASTPYSGALDITGDIELVARLSMTDWTPAAQSTIIAKRGSSTTRTYNLDIATTGVMVLIWSPDGTTLVQNTSAVPPFTNGTTYWVKATMDVDNGSGSRVVNFYWAPDQAAEPTAWTLLTTAGGASTSIGVTNSPLEIGTINTGQSQVLNGTVQRAIVRNGIAGTTVFDANFATAPRAATSFSSGPGGAPYLTGSGLAFGGATPINGTVSTPDDPALNITGDIELVSRVNLADYTSGGFQYPVGKFGSLANSAYAMFISGSGAIGITWVDSGGTQRTASRAAPPTLVDGTTYWLKATLDVDNGSGQYDAKFYYAADQTSEPTTWTQWGTTVTGTTGTTTISNGTAPLTIGNISTGGAVMNGTVYRTIVRNGIGGTLVLDANTATATANATTFTASTAVPGYTPTFTVTNSYIVPVTINEARGNAGTNQVLIGDDTRVTNALSRLNNLSDVSSTYLSRQNLGLTQASQWDIPASAYLTGVGLNLPGVGGNYASTPDDPSLDITGDLEVVARLVLSDYTNATNAQYVMGKWGTVAADQSWYVRMTSGGLLNLVWYDAAGTLNSRSANVVAPFTDGFPYWIKVTLDVDNGSGGSQPRFYYAADQTTEPSTWTEIGTAVTPGSVTDIRSGAGTMWLGALGSSASFSVTQGTIYQTIVRSGIGGTTVLDANFATAPRGATSFTATGKTVTITESRPNAGVNQIVVGDDTRVTGAVQSTLVDAKGDLLVGTANDTVARLPVGTNNYVLTADSTTTEGVKWAAAGGGGGTTGYAFGIIPTSRIVNPTTASTTVGTPAAVYTGTGANVTANVGVGVIALTRSYHTGQTVTQVGFAFATASPFTVAGDSVVIGVYNDSNGAPTTLAWSQTFTIGTSTSTQWLTTGLSHVMPSGACWIAVINPSTNSGSGVAFRGAYVPLNTVSLNNDNNNAVSTIASQASLPADLSSNNFRTSAAATGQIVPSGAAFPKIGLWS